MSFNILGDHKLDIDVKLIKRVIGKKDQIFDIELSSINSLQIDDNLMRMGLYGVIEINNKANILDTLGINSSEADDLFIAISIKDLELSKVDSIEPHQLKIEFLGLVEKTTTASANFEDNIIIFEFEEAVVADMQHTSWDNFILKSAKSGSLTSNAEVNVVELAKKFYETTWLETNEKADLKEIVAESPYKPDVKLPIYLVQERNNDSLHKVLLNLLKCSKAMGVQKKNTGSGGWFDAISLVSFSLPSFRFNNTDSFYKVLSNLLTHSQTTNYGGAIRAIADFFTGKEAFNLPSFRFNNTEKGRQLIFKPYFTDKHRAFIEEVREKGLQGKETDFSEVYTEKFTFGPFAKITGFTDRNTNWHNSIEGETITRPDTGTLMEKVWTNFFLIDGAEDEDGVDNIGQFGVKLISYAQVALNFVESELGLKGKQGINLPLIDPAHQKKQMVYKVADKTGQLSSQARYNFVHNAITKSFVTVNEQIEFECKGAIYRTPGKFIWIERTKETSQLEKLWYVNSIQHSIVDGKYTTKIIANSFFGQKTSQDYDDLAKGVIKKTKDDAEILIEDSKRLDASGDRGPVPPPERVQEKTKELEEKSAPPEPKFYKDPLTSEQIKKLQESDEYKKMSAENQRRWNRENIPGYVDDQDRSIQQIREKDPEAFFTAQKAGQAAFQKFLKDNGFKK